MTATPDRSIEEQLATMAAERDRIAGEIHDDPVQAITAVSLVLQRLAARLDAPADRALIDEARALAETAVDRLRHMLFVLHPSTLEEDGLATTLEVYLEEYVSPLGIGWTVTSEGSVEPVVGTAALAFRLAREAVWNAAKHAQPSKISIDVKLDSDVIMLMVADDGSGFDPATAVDRAGHRGLAHSSALARSAHGTYDVLSSPGHGTTVTITMPVAGLV